MTNVYYSEATAPASWAESIEARQIFGPKAAGLMLVPRAWTLPFILVRADEARDLFAQRALDATLVQQLQSLAGESRQLIVRSSVVGETIWDRGTYNSVVVNLDEENWIDAFQAACTHVLSSASDCACAVVLQ